MAASTQTKSKSPFGREEQALADFAAALAHPARIAIINLLQEHGELACGRIVEQLPLAQATVSQHLQHLSEAGLVSHRSCGKRNCYRLNCEQIRHFCHSFQCALGTAGDEKQPETTSSCCQDEGPISHI